MKNNQGDSVDFIRLEPQDLTAIPIIVQALDNQWVPRSLLRPSIRRGMISKASERTLKQMVRAQYLWALINLRQMVINRAYLYNNQAVFQDYLQSGRNRHAFKAFLEEGTIIPFLFTETSPTESPPFDVDSRGFVAWQQLGQEVRMQVEKE